MHQSIVTMPDHLQESLSYLKKRISARPVVAVILGSGLGDFANHLKKRIVISVEDVPFYPHLTIEGHSGNIIFGTLSDKEILVFQGRVHYYEEGDLSNVLYPIHIAHGLGIKKLLVTNAAGGINRQFRPGDLMLITDQINLTFENLHPRSPKGRLNKNAPGKRYQTYDTKLQSILWEVALSKGISLRCGVYCGVKGPSYETAAEIEMIRRIGGDA